MDEYIPTPRAWRAVDQMFTDTLVHEDDALRSAVLAEAAAGMPAIEVAPVNGKFLHLLARMSHASRILEIGTLAGYSTIWLARALPADGRIVTIEAEPAHAEIARANVQRAGVAERVDVREGKALTVLAQLEDDEPFDFVFIDADKESNAAYLDYAARLTRRGAVIVVDNVVRGGRIVDAHSTDPQVIGVRRGLDMLARDHRFDATALQTLDRKGWDGVAIAMRV